MTDTFWKSFWVFFGTALVVCMGSGVGAFLLEARNTSMGAVADAYNPNKDPFEAPLIQGTAPTYSLGGVLYRDSLPLGYASWDWQTTSVWQSSEEHNDGSYSLKITFQKQMSTAGMSGTVFSIGTNHSLSLAVYPDSSVGDLYLQLYDKAGNAYPMQSLGWYTQSGTLVPGEWQTLSIPLSNLMASGTQISGFAITAKNPGTAYIDSIELEQTAVNHAAWVAPPEIAGLPYDPLATSSTAAIPYTLTLSPDGISNWYDYYGTFRLATSGPLLFGPQPGGNNDAIAIYRLGKAWEDYVIQSKLTWGLTGVFSLIVRFTDSSDYAECSFSHYGDTVQIYDVKAGQSTLVSQTPTLAIRYDEPWVDVRVGAQVQGKELDCFVGGTQVLTANLDDLSRSGTVGIEAWDQNSYASPHSIEQYSVTPTVHD